MAGIGIAVGVAALGGIAMGYYIFRRRAKKQQYAAQQYAAQPHAAEEGPVPDMEQKPVYLVPELAHDRALYELHGQSGSTMVHELSGDWTRH